MTIFTLTESLDNASGWLDTAADCIMVARAESDSVDYNTKCEVALGQIDAAKRYVTSAGLSFPLGDDYSTEPEVQPALDRPDMFPGESAEQAKRRVQAWHRGEHETAALEARRALLADLEPSTIVVRAGETTAEAVRRVQEMAAEPPEFDGVPDARHSKR